MPDYKSYKKSKNSKNSKNSKSGGRHRKHTMKKYRRGRKVMRGGYSNEELAKAMSSMKGTEQSLVGDYLHFISKNQTKNPYTWSQDIKNNTIKQELDKDPTLNDKINNNEDLMKLLKYPLLDVLSPQQRKEPSTDDDLVDVQLWNGQIIKMPKNK